MPTTADTDQTFEITFFHARRGRKVTFTRTACSVPEAINSARHGFQWCYGYWNPERPAVKMVS